MSNAMVPMAEIQVMAAAVAKSGLFGVKTPEQAMTLMLISQAEGRHPALAARDYDIIQNKPAKKAEAMLRDFLYEGGKVEWHKLDDTIADATFSHPSGGTVRIEWTMKRAVSAGLGGRDMWKKYPRQMLRSRTVSEGIRTVCPMATSGMYVPEEVHDIAKERDITPTAGIADNINSERQNEIKSIADKVQEWLNAGSVGDAICEADNAGLDAEETIYLWTFFGSKDRRKVTDERARMKKALAAPPAEAEKAPLEGVVEKDEATITDAQKKRLEAVIGEFGLDRDAVKSYCKNRFGTDHFKDLSKTQYNQLDEWIAAQQPAGQPDALLVLAQEWAETGTEKYAEWFKGLTADQRKHIGADRHAKFKEIAAKVI